LIKDRVVELTSKIILSHNIILLFTIYLLVWVLLETSDRHNIFINIFIHFIVNFLVDRKSNIRPFFAIKTSIAGSNIFRIYILGKTGLMNHMPAAGEKEELIR